MESNFVAPAEKEGEYTAFDVRINHACCYLCLAESGHCSVCSLLFLFQINKGITVTLFASSCLSDQESPSQRVPTKTRSLCHCQWLHCALLSFSFWSLVLLSFMISNNKTTNSMALQGFSLQLWDETCC